MRKFLFILISLILSSCSVTKRLKKDLNASFENTAAFQKGFSGLAIYDLETKKMLYEHNSGKYFTPASNTKLFTFYTGLKLLGDSIPAFHYTIKNDTLYIKPTGDPSFLNPDLPSSGAYKFLKKNGNSVVYLKPEYQDKRLGPGWSWDDFDSYYSAEKFPFPMYGNLAIFNFGAGQTSPSVKPKIFQDSVFTDLKTSDNKYIQRDLEKNEFRFQKMKRDDDFSQYIPIRFSDKILKDLLEDTLHKNVFIRNEKSFAEELKNTFYSISSDSVYKQMLQVSDNFIAEQILLMASEKISDSLKTEIAINYMKENYLKDLPDEAFWRDGSGLSRYNLFTPSSIVKLLEKISQEIPQEKLLDFLPTGGQSGTIKNYYKANEPYVFAKTGSLSNNHSLSGFLKTKSGKYLIFSFMNSNFTVPSAEIKAGMEKILLEVRDHYGN
ncbi:D-alanyl-D-alanine carboxypeptidase [Gramella sp. AN32]|uniref:D-alanyl-D-alanine carboxypeptidase/D-alanyl-D-alanine-endopeptidase n=1 Tax=Christiangramia antarctica TaxID=2058158 RepID=A0ABW5X8E0_9FLAO|nr:D-alanyl-D-alanine carboxypeptidase [Gramella sp. AN32]MCM4155858.1 D-alanyl-D-alanine carboxypeptidase [Gramella sp. AN32]